MATVRERLFSDGVYGFDILDGVVRMEFVTFSKASREKAGRALP